MAYECCGAASYLGMNQTVVFAYETIKKIHPRNIKFERARNAYLEVGNTEKAIETGNLF